MPQRARADIRNPQPEDVFGEGIIADLMGFLGMGQMPGAADLMSPIGGMARIGKSGSKFIDKFLTREGRVYDIDPENLQNITHSKYAREKFGEELGDFVRKGGVRGSEFGLEFAVDATGKPIPGKQTMDRSIQTLMKSFNERGLPFDETVYLDLLQPGGRHKPVETTLIELMQSRGR